MSFEPGCTTVSAIAVASAASTALPPRRSTARPAAAASGCEVATTPLPAKTGLRSRPGNRPVSTPDPSSRDQPAVASGHHDGAGQVDRALAVPGRDQRVEGGDVPVGQVRAGAAEPQRPAVQDPARAPRPAARPAHRSRGRSSLARRPSSTRAAQAVEGGSVGRDQGGGPGQVGHHRRAERVHKGLKQPAGPGPGEGRVVVVRVVPRREPERRARRPGLPTGRSPAAAAAAPHRRPGGAPACPAMPARPAAPQQREQDGLGLVVRGCGRAARPGPPRSGRRRPAPRSGPPGRPPPGPPAARPPSTGDHEHRVEAQRLAPRRRPPRPARPSRAATDGPL